MSDVPIAKPAELAADCRAAIRKLLFSAAWSSRAEKRQELFMLQQFIAAAVKVAEAQDALAVAQDTLYEPKSGADQSLNDPLRGRLAGLRRQGGY